MKIVHIIGIVLGIIFMLFLLSVLFFFWNLSSFSNGAKIISKNLSNQYYFKNEGVVFVRGANFFSLGAMEIENADPDSFEVLAYNLAKDKSHVYYNEMIIENADPKTFEMISTGKLYIKKYTFYSYTKDAESVFFLYKQIKGADTSSYKYLWGDFSRDNKNLFYMENKLTSIIENPKKVKNDIDENYVSIGQAIYYQDLLIKDVNVDSFSVIKETFSKDNRAVYFKNMLLNGIDPSSFEILNTDYQRDKNNLYYQTKPISQSDPNSYEFINTLFSKDKNHLYHFGLIVIGIQPKNYRKKEVERLDNNRSLINLIYDDSHTLFAKRNELVEISRIHNLYNNEVYCLNTRVIGADYKTFKVLEGCEEMYAVDKQHVFYYSLIVKGADITSFQIINSKFTKDKNHVYFFERRLQDINPDTFVYQEGMYGETIDEDNSKLVYP